MKKQYCNPTWKTVLLSIDVITSSDGEFGFNSNNDVVGKDPGFFGGGELQ